MDDDDVDIVASWFDVSELVQCPRCGERKLAPPSASRPTLRVCLACGVLPSSDAENHPPREDA